MEDGTILDSQLSASSVYRADHGAANARLNFKEGNGQMGSWSTSSSDLKPWLKADFLHPTTVTRIDTQGRNGCCQQWVTKFTVSYSEDNVAFQDYMENGQVKEFYGNSDQNTVVKNVLDPPIVARYIRIHPKQWKNHVSMRAEFRGCSGATICNVPLGMQDGTIPDSHVSASSEYDTDHRPANARLHLQASSTRKGAWSAKVLNKKQWLQADFGQPNRVTGIDTQGRNGCCQQWVTKFTVSYSRDNDAFQEYMENGVVKEFFGNRDSDSVAHNFLYPPIVARYVRIHPKEWNNWISMRVEIRGCFGAPPTGPPPPVVPVPIPSLEVKTRAVPGDGKNRLEVYAQCTLSKEPSKEFEHEASWVINGRLVPLKLEEGKLQYDLKELEQGFKAGTTVSCQIRGKFKDGEDTRWSAYTKSKEIYTGIMITPKFMKVCECDPGKPIVASMAFPIDGSGTDANLNKDIALKLKRSGTSPNDVVLSKRIMRIREGQVKSDGVIVTAVRDFVKDGNKRMRVTYALVNNKPGGSKFWEGYKGRVKTRAKREPEEEIIEEEITIIEETTEVTIVDEETTTCVSTGDPHITSFDGRYYDQLRDPGDYILTRNTRRNFEIHARIHRCWRVVCNCGVVIRENNDVIKIDKCKGGPVVQQLSPEPVNGRVRVKRRNLGATTEFRVFLESGTEVKVIAASYGVNLYVTAPSDDARRTAGQCGNNNKNKNDEPGNNWLSFKIETGQSLFHKLPAKVEPPAAICPPNSNGNYLSCAVRRPGVNLNHGTDVKLTPGPLRYGGGRRKRSYFGEAGLGRLYRAQDYEDHELFYDFDYSMDITRREEELGSLPAWGTMGVTEEQARSKCLATLQSSGAGKACAGLDVGMKDRMSECMVDIQVTGDLSIADSALSSMTHLCVEQASKNPELLEKDENGNLVPPSNIVGAICPNDCSEMGQCKGGKCVCNSGFGAEDCSIDLNKPPEVTGIQNDGLCDLDKSWCLQIRLQGSKFLESDKLTCHFMPFKIQDSEEVPDGDALKSKANLLSAFEVACPYPMADQEKLPWKFYVSVSNNGVDQSARLKTVVYDILCHACDKEGTCSPNVDKERTCMINGICFGVHEFKQGNRCLRCEPYASKNKWTKNNDDKCPTFHIERNYDVCEGQSFKLPLRATDPEETKVSFSLGEGSPESSSVADGAFTWSVTGEGKKSASIVASDQCGQSCKHVIEMTIYQCNCQNGGQCLSDTEDGPECAFSLRCKCPDGFTGDRCEKKV